MRILTIGDSWTYGSESSDPARFSWPSQLSTKYNIEVVNLGRGGSSNQRATRIGIEEISRDSNYDWVIWGICPASRTEILKNGKWHQIWPNANSTDALDKIFTEFWHPWNDVQSTLLLIIQFMSFVKMMGPKLIISSLSFVPSHYEEQFKWIIEYKDDNNFAALDMPLQELNIGIKDLDRKLKSLRAIHNIILKDHPDYLYDVGIKYMKSPNIEQKYGKNIWAPKGHPNDLGYGILCDYFAEKIGLVQDC
jgi:hypothetical protein